MEEIARLQCETKHKLRQSRKSFRRLAKTSKPVKVVYAKAPTEPVDFHFRTEERERERGKALADQSSSGAALVDFPSTLRRSHKGDNWMVSQPQWGMHCLYYVHKVHCTLYIVHCTCSFQ